MSINIKDIKPRPKTQQVKTAKSDAFFHQVAMETEGETEKKDLEALTTLAPALAEQQIIKMLDAQHRLDALAGFRQLVKLYPDHSQRVVWDGLIRMLEKK